MMLFVLVPFSRCELGLGSLWNDDIKFVVHVFDVQKFNVLVNMNY